MTTTTKTRTRTPAFNLTGNKSHLLPADEAKALGPDVVELNQIASEAADRYEAAGRALQDAKKAAASGDPVAVAALEDAKHAHRLAEGEAKSSAAHLWWSVGDHRDELVERRSKGLDQLRERRSDLLAQFVEVHADVGAQESAVNVARRAGEGLPGGQLCGAEDLADAGRIRQQVDRDRERLAKLAGWRGRRPVVEQSVAELVAAIEYKVNGEAVSGESEPAG